MLEQLIGKARDAGASDLHLEAGLAAHLRVNGTLHPLGVVVNNEDLVTMAKGLLGHDAWQQFLRQRSYDSSKTIAGVRCRINVLHSVRGVGLAIRLLTSFQASIRKLNLHPDIGRFAKESHGLVIVSGATGSGKSSTMAALVQEINTSQARHILTLESPIEYYLRPQKSLIRQRQVGRDTPSFEQGLTDALREDPDVIVVGEMRTPEVIRLTLNAAETGHLVFATLHSATPGEALSRVIAAFPPEVARGVCAQLADSLVGVVCQQLVYNERQQLRIPQAEVLVASSAVKANIRNGEMFKLASLMEIGGKQGMWSRDRYRAWLREKKDFYKPSRGNDDLPDTEPTTPPLLSSPSPTLAPVEAQPAHPVAAASISDGVDEHGDGGSEIEGLIQQLRGKS